MYKLNDSTGWNRKKSSFFLYTVTIIVSTLIIYLNKNGVGVFLGRSFLEQIDDVVINYILPLSAIVISVLTLKYVEKSFLKNEFDVDEKIENLKIYYFWRFFLYFIMPSIYIFFLVLRVL